MISTKLIDEPGGGGVLPDITSPGRVVQGVRDQTGVATGIIFQSGSNTFDYKFEVQGSADDGGTWHPLIGSELGGTSWIEQRVGGIGFTIEFPMMPMIRFFFSQNAAGSGTTGVYQRCEAWLVE